MLAEVAIAIPIPAEASAGVRLYRGKVIDEEITKISFRVNEKGAKAVVSRFRALRLPTTCGVQNSITSFGHLGFDLRDNGRFSGEEFIAGTRGGGTAYVRGRIRNRTATGTVRYVEAFDNVIVCDTGLLRWRARRTELPHRDENG